jgi:hypothetical protein
MNYADETIVWIRDKNGRELACRIDNMKRRSNWDIDPDEIEQERCVDVSRLVGSKRW